jgi:hypothetical protein
MKRIYWLNLLLIITCALAAPATGGEMYRWTDENGVVHFSETPPADREVAAENLPADTPPATSAATAGTEGANSPAQQRREELARKHDEARTNAAQNDAQCAAWRAELQRLEPNRRVFYTNEQGETERMDDVARTDRVAELKSLIARNCN